MSSHIAVLEIENPRAMHPSSCFAARLTRPAKDPVPYSREALKQDLQRVRIAWEDCQASRDRNAIYGYLSAVFDLVMWWAAEGRAVSRARWALQLQHLDLPTTGFTPALPEDPAASMRDNCSGAYSPGVAQVCYAAPGIQATINSPSGRCARRRRARH